MAKYEVIKYAIRCDKRNHKYMYFTLSNTEIVWEDLINIVMHNDLLVKAFEKYEYDNMQSEEPLPLPDELRYVHGRWDYYKPGFSFYKKHLYDHPATTTRPEIKAGDIVCNNGIPVVCDTIKVFGLGYLDNDNKFIYLKGESPYEKGNMILSKYCVPVGDVTEPELDYMVELTMDNNNIHRTNYRTTATKIRELCYMIDCLVKGATLNVYQHVCGYRTVKAVTQNGEEEVSLQCRN